MKLRCEDPNCSRYGQELDEDGVCRSKRKAHNQDAGYIASLKSGLNKGWAVIYDAKEAGVDDTDGKYTVVCQTHNTIVNTTSLPKARSALKAVDFCEKCRIHNNWKPFDRRMDFGWHDEKRQIALTVIRKTMLVTCQLSGD